jgi:hypothetical protein
VKYRIRVKFPAVTSEIAAANEIENLVRVQDRRSSAGNRHRDA